MTTVKQLADRRGIQPASVQKWLKRRHAISLSPNDEVPDEIAQSFLKSTGTVTANGNGTHAEPTPTLAPFYRRAVEKPTTSKLSTFQKWAPIVPLPLLGIPASYGVYHFALQFVPQWVAVVEAGAFEATYIGLAAANSLPKELRGQATRISWGAVWVSVIYNTIAGALSREPELFDRLQSADTFGAVLFWLLALVHGAPLAVLAYLVSDLHIHKRQ